MTVRNGERRGTADRAGAARRPAHRRRQERSDARSRYFNARTRAGVAQLRIGGRHDREELAGLRQVTGPLVQVGQRVGDAEVVRLGPLGGRLRRLEHADGVLETTLIGEGAGVHDAALGDEGGAGRRGAQLLPELRHLGVPAERSVAVGEHRVLLGAAAEGAEGLQLRDGELPAAEAVVGQPQELTNGLGGRRLLGQRSQEGAGLLEPLAAEGLARVLEASVQPIGGAGGHRPAQRWVGREGALVGGAGRTAARAPAADGLVGLAPHDAFVDPHLRFPGLPTLRGGGSEGLRCVARPGVAHPSGALAGDTAPAGLLDLGVVVGALLPRRALALPIALVGAGGAPLAASLAGAGAGTGTGRTAPAGGGRCGGLGHGVGSLSTRPSRRGAENDEGPPSLGVLRSENSAASYSPRASRPKYHRRWRA